MVDETHLSQRGSMNVELAATLTRFANGYLKAGIIDGQQPHPDADGNVRLTMGELAVIHEFGAPSAGIPPRSFIWLGAQLVKTKLKSMMARLVLDIRRGHTTEQAALRKVGELLQSGMRKTFAEWEAHWSALAASTIAAKGHEQPLIDTRALYDAIDFEVIMPGKR